MNKYPKKLLAIIPFLLTTFFVVAESSPELKGTTTLKHVMKGLLTDTKLITEGIINEDFNVIEKAANRIANHPAPDLSIKLKLMRSLGSDMSKFKSYDTKVHDISVNLVKSARLKDMESTLVGYQKLITGCQSCHAEFKQPVSNLLSKD